jgi:SAM-dependent methyltransferase
MMVENDTDLRKLIGDLAGRVPAKGAGLETGTHRGRATWMLADAFDPARFALIDPWATDAAYRDKPFAQKTTDAALESARSAVLDSHGARPGVEVHQARSQDALAALEAGTFDWAYLDGCKYYRDLLADLDRCFDLLKPGGVVLGAGLDWAPQLGYPVEAAVRSFAARIDPAPEVLRHGSYFGVILPEGARLRDRDARERYLVVSTMKNEAPFILEWVAHYRALGFTDLLVYTNDCDDATVPLLDRLAERGLLRHEPNDVLRRGPHKSALKYAQDHWLVAEADWVLICDVDEFLNLRRHDTIRSYLGSLPDDTDMVTFPWQVFGCGEVLAFEDRPVTDQFVRCEAGPEAGGARLRDIKTIFRRPAEVDRFGLHRPRFENDTASGFVWRRPNGADISEKMNTSAAARERWRAAADTAYMNHYPIRAVESYLVKKLRGRANHVGEDLGETYFNRWNLNDQTDTSIQRFAGVRAREQARLMDDAETARLHAEGVRQFTARIAELKETPGYQALYQTLCTAVSLGAPKEERE